MKIQLIAVGEKMPAWVMQGYEEYAKRLPRECELGLVEISAVKRNKNTNISRVLEKEGAAILKAISKNAHIIALDVGGQAWSTEDLSENLKSWMSTGSDIALLVGGPEGLSEDCLRKANQKWSLSCLTLPHPLVRVVVAESLYRAWTLLNNHPYHRA